jgi:HD-GYP domain-containing protein (c-di-GMP phosphodiesterase class II)
MQKHPVYAYEMLSPIDFLIPAIDIPYCHHEKWDGTGYPRGLKEEEIPFAARIFPVVDVWDALTSDRPYHKAFPPLGCGSGSTTTRETAIRGLWKYLWS